MATATARFSGSAKRAEWCADRRLLALPTVDAAPQNQILGP